MPDETGEQDRVEAQVRRVMKAFEGRADVAVESDELERAVRGTLAQWRQAPVQDFVPVLAERSVREQLRGRSQSPAAEAQRSG